MVMHSPGTLAYLLSSYRQHPILHLSSVQGPDASPDILGLNRSSIPAVCKSVQNSLTVEHVGSFGSE